MLVMGVASSDCLYSNLFWYIHDSSLRHQQALRINANRFLALNVEYEGYKQEEKIFKRLESPYYVDQSQNNIHQHKTSYIRSDIS